MKCVLVNVHSDNFGDYLNALAAESFCRDVLGADVHSVVYSRNLWTTAVPFRSRPQATSFLRDLTSPDQDLPRHV